MFLRRVVRSAVKVQRVPHQLCIKFWLVLALNVKYNNAVCKQREQAEKNVKCSLRYCRKH